MGSDVSLGTMWVEYDADLSKLQSKMVQFRGTLLDADGAAQSAGSNITSAFTSAGDAILEFGSQASAGEEALTNLGSVGEEASTEIGAAIADASASVGESVSEINSEIDSIGTNAEEAAAQSQSSFSGFDLGGMINQAGMTIFSLQAMGNVAVQTGQSLLGPAEAAENTQASFSNLLGSTQAATNELGQLNDFAAKTQFQTQDIDNMAASMIAFKTPTQDIVPELSAVGDALTAVGKGTPAEMQGVVDILGKIGIQGKLTQGDITQLGAHGINAMDLITEGSGKTAAEIQKMIKDGTLPATDAIKDLTTGIESNPVYSGGMAKQSNTLSGQMSTLSSNWNQVMSAFGSPVLKSLEPIIGEVGTTLSSSSFKDFAGSIGQKIVQAFSDIGTAVQNAGQFFNNPTFKQLADLLGGQLATAAQNLARYFDSPAFAKFAKVAGQDIAGALLNTTKAIESVVTWTIQWHEPILIVGGVIASLFVPALIQSGVESVIAGGKIATNFITSIVSTGVEGWQAAGGIATWIAGVIASGAQSVAAGAQIVGSWVAGVVSSGVEAVVAGAKIAGSFVLSMAKAGIQAALTAGAFVADLIPAIVSFVAESLTAAATAIPSMLAGFGAWVVSAGAAAIATLAATWPILAIVAAIGLLVAGIVLAIQHWGDIVAFFQAVWTNAWNGISSFFSNIIHFIQDHAIQFGEGLLIAITGPVGLLIIYVITHWTQIWSFLVGIWKNIQNIFSNVGSFFSGIGQGMWNGVKSGIDMIIGGIDNFIGFIDGLQIHIPAFQVAGIGTPAFDWNGLGIPKIPMLAAGGTVAAGQEFIAGEQGPELVRSGSGGASVSSHGSTMAMITMAVLAALASQQQQQPVIHVHVSSPDLYVDGQQVTSALAPHIANAIRLEGGLRAK